ncbi:leucine-rich repeat LGI family member 2 isoform X2 [Pelobates fuscus]|uniref:leucine-rich repeat LGI family member 2 isoform X2 n=1 Tax=Pelobates fuscus TaxID=191477 RepID=UPI002FE46CC9
MALIKKPLLFLILLGCTLQAVQPKRSVRCPSTCSCTKESVICVGSSSIPKSLPSDISSLSLVNGTFSEIRERIFTHLPTLQLLFIEGNKVETISKYAFRGLRNLINLSLANNHIKTLPRDIFSDLDSLIELDLRGNMFECDCKAKWLFSWLKMTNSTVSHVLCSGPSDYQGKKLNEVASFDAECITTDFIDHQSLPYQSVSVDTFHYKNDVFVAIAQPSMENCMILEWDHIEMNFRIYDNITGQSIVGCKAILLDDQVFMVVAQLFGGSHIYKYDESWAKFTKFQDIEVSRISKPNDVELFQIEGETFFVIADSSKAGLTTVYKWNGKGFYSYQSLHEWFRDTDAELIEIDDKYHLVLSSRSQVPLILQWNKITKKFTPHSDIPNMEDVLAVKSFRMKDELYISLTRFIGDSKIMKWNNNQFKEIQALPSRGAMSLQPFSFKDRYYLALGSDYTFSQIYQWDVEKKIFEKFKEIYIQGPRSFTAVSTDRRDFLFASSFKGNTQILEHVIVDLSL